MYSYNHIRYLQHDEIDMEKWDHCIRQSSNELIYGYSWYLDEMAVHWDGLILGDYEVVMPLTWNRKYGLYYLYQPAFTASLGIFGEHINNNLVTDFIAAIPKKFRLVEIAMNHANNVGTNKHATQRDNYTIPLNSNYESLVKSYKENIRRNIKKAVQLGCTCKKDIPVSDVIALSKPFLQNLTNASDADYIHFEKLYAFLDQRKQAMTYGIYSSTHELVASCAYFFSRKRAYYILVGNHPNGKTMGASHYLIDRFIHDHAGQDLLLDFEGSDIRNLAYFYSSFGATLEHYPFLRINNLPIWAKWLKK